MAKRWFLKIEGKELGPFTKQELKEHPMVTPDTLVREEGDVGWIRIGSVKELEEIFKDPEEDSDSADAEAKRPFKLKRSLAEDGEIVLDYSFTPLHYILWLLILLLTALYVWKGLQN